MVPSDYELATHLWLILYSKASSPSGEGSLAFYLSVKLVGNNDGFWQLNSLVLTLSPLSLFVCVCFMYVSETVVRTSSYAAYVTYFKSCSSKKKGVCVCVYVCF